MNARQRREEIRDTNMCLLQLMQKMIRLDKLAALDSLGVNDEMADLVTGLSFEQLTKMSSTGLMMCCFHFDESVLLGMVGNYTEREAELVH